MRTMTGVEARLDEDLSELMTRIRVDYAWERMSVEEHHQVLAVYLAVDKLSQQLLAGELDY
jgi:hypothetical protein